MNAANLLALRWLLTKDVADFELARRLLLAWAATLVTTGSAFHEHGILPAATAYFKIRHGLTDVDRSTIEQWLHSFQQAHYKWLMTRPAAGSSATRQRHYSNVVTWSLATQATIAAVLGDEIMKLALVSNVTQHLSGHFASDGSVFDFLKRDAVAYVTYDLTGLVHLGHAMSYMMADDYFLKPFRDYKAPEKNGTPPQLIYEVNDQLPGKTISSVGNFLQMQASKVNRHIEYANTTYDGDKKKSDYLKPWEPGEWYRTLSTVSYDWTRHDSKMAANGSRYASKFEYLLGDWRDYLIRQP